MVILLLRSPVSQGQPVLLALPVGRPHPAQDPCIARPPFPPARDPSHHRLLLHQVIHHRCRPAALHQLPVVLAQFPLPRCPKVSARQLEPPDSRFRRPRLAQSVLRYQALLHSRPHNRALEVLLCPATLAHRLHRAHPRRAPRASHPQVAAQV